MATRKTAPKKRPTDEYRTAKQLRQLAQRARGEVSELLKNEAAGTITRLELKAELEELQEKLKQLAIFTHKL